MSLKTYYQKRKFSQTPEPKGKVVLNKKGQLMFMIHEHHASHLHFDLRLELDGVLKSWAVPKGPSNKLMEKRLAVQVEDHPLAYAKFQGTIPEGNYGAGDVYIWDKGKYQAIGATDRKDNEKMLRAGIKKGHLKLYFDGEKMNGEYALVRMSNDPKNWLLIKEKNSKSSRTNVFRQARKEQSNMIAGRKVNPMLAKLVEVPFDQEGWIFEVKWDGYRGIAEIDKRQVQFYSRNGLSYEDYFPLLIEELKNVKEQMILDGEVVVVDENGRANFQLIQNYKNSGEGNLVYYVFDILEYKGRDLRNKPLLERKKILQKVIPKLPNVKLSEYIETKGKEFFQLAVDNGIEGIMAKSVDSPYLEGQRGDFWKKIKNINQQEAVICGITQPRRSRKEFGALVLGVYQDGEMVYIGHTGSGFDEKTLGNVKKLLNPLFTESCPFKKVPKTNAPVQWVKPKIVCEVKFANWTEDGLMRVPIFLGIREDKEPSSVKKELPEKVKNRNKKRPVGEKKEFSNLEKIYWPKEKYTKGDLINYYENIADYILPYLKDRPEILHRYPNGINKPAFYQKDLGNLKGLQSVKIYSEGENKYIDYGLCQDKYSLLYMANLGCIEIHPWNSRQQHLDNPDYLIIDLDPLDISFDKVIETALVTRKILKKAGIEGYCKTSGATGLHVYIPMGAKYSTEQVLQFGKILAILINTEIPEITSIERMPKKRKGKVYLDYLQNRRGQSIVAPYSVRPRPGATVSTPLQWNEVKKGLDPKSFNLKTIIPRLKKKGDLWKGVLEKGIDMEKALKKLSATK